MTLVKLRTFVVVAEREHATRAAGAAWRFLTVGRQIELNAEGRLFLQRPPRSRNRAAWRWKPTSGVVKHFEALCRTTGNKHRNRRTAATFRLRGQARVLRGPRKLRTEAAAAAVGGAYCLFVHHRVQSAADQSIFEWQ